MPLSIENQVDLIKFYSLRDLGISEFTQMEQLNANKKSSNDTDCKKIDFMLKNSSNILLCQGNTQALMLLAFVLRTKKM
jgi:hypothetical protein